MNSFGAALVTLGMGVVVATSAALNSVAADSPPPLPAPDAPTPIAPTPAQTSQPGASATGTGAPQSTAFGALDYFQNSCARCHGDYGSFYGSTFGKSLDNAKMTSVVHDMAFGPAQSPLEDKDLKVLVAWHCALRDQKPFVSVVKAESSAQGWTLSGEASPGTSLSINGKPISLTGHIWKATVGAKGPFQLQAKLGDKITTLDALKAAYSAP